MARLWPYPPRPAYREDLYFPSEALRAYSSDQGIALTPAPRQRMDLTFPVERRVLPELLDALTAYAEEDWRVPIWHDRRQTGPVAAADQVLQVSTEYSDFRVGEGVFIYAARGSYAVGEIAGVSSSQVTLVDPIGADFDKALVMPLRDFFLTASPSYSDGAYGEVGLKLEARSDELIAAPGGVQYQGYPVLGEAPQLVGNSGSIGEVVTYHDSGLGPVVREPIRGFLDQLSRLSYIDATAEKIWARRAWALALGGKQKPFWLPSFRKDLKLVSDVSAASSVLVIESQNTPLDAVDVQVALKSGATAYVRIISEVDSGTTKTLGLESPFGITIEVSQVNRMSIMGLARLDSSTVSIEHDVRRARTSFVARSTKQ